MVDIVHCQIRRCNMPIICNVENNVIFQLDFINNGYLDIKKERANYENWIPFVLKLIVSDKIYGYTEEHGATFTVFEIEKFIAKLEDIITFKTRNLEFSRYEFSSSEGYFDFVIFDPLEANEVYIEIWINNAINSEGIIFGYDDGVRFVTTIDCLKNFKNELSIIFQHILHSQIDRED